MPANPKYLSSNWQKFAKLTCGFIGGYMVSGSLHLLIGSLVAQKQNYLVTSIVSIYLLWGVLLILPYLFRNGWRVWFLYIVITGMNIGLYYYFL